MLYQVEGVDAYCYSGGKPFDPAQPSAVFLHGAQNDHSVWALQTRYFAHHGWNVLAPDLPGHGRSKGAAKTSVEALAVWLLALLDAAGIEQALLVGHSMGALIALQASLVAPQRVSRLALLGAAYPMRVSDALLDAAKTDEPGAIDMITIWSHASIAQKPAFPGPGFYTMGGARRLQQRIAHINPDNVLHTDLCACNAYTGGQAAARAAQCPTLFMLGQYDMMTPPRSSQLLTSTISHGTVVMLDSGHAMMAEQPDSVLDTLYGFAVGQ
ncbi:alpha/beta fold hydrolase [Janthinobacterium agaricidamnosum]|uniref:Alpha/beta hydrolase fold family protein n=1 Tax=Janthinobacterium agaricidamnosum NBRC 102515 = DSM 9628 TaxID=1349767 RepID=W0V231_9BURK|nr:alpha/beta hydrolase [Janthinobacterium agaricidamnosum]CDG82884.1 alpha/beta hydrolase fold family protein [Janthinobacterium agaricidamnosum NBRC 102515 = DSM 9628]